VNGKPLTDDDDAADAMLSARFLFHLLY